MPEKGFKSVTIKEDVYDRLSDCASKTYRSISMMVEFLVDKYCKDDLLDLPNPIVEPKQKEALP